MGKSAESLIQEANKLMAKKKYKKALAIYFKMCEIRPIDYRAWIKVGDVLKLLGEEKQALAAYIKAANGFAQQGHLMQAIAVNKLILEIEPKHTQVQQRLAKLYAVQDKQKERKQKALDEELETLKKQPEKLNDAEILEVDYSDDDSDEPAITTHRLDDISVPVESDEAVQAKLEDMPQTPLFSDLEPDQFASIISKLGFERVQEGEKIISEGEQGDSLYIIASGSAKVSKKAEDGSEIFLGTMTEGTFFGEIALFEGGERTATVTATEETALIEISKEHLLDITADHPQVEATMDQFYKQRLLRTVLRFSEPFKEVPEFHLLAIIKRFNVAELEPGVNVIAAGAKTPGLIVIESGTISAYGDGLSQPKNLSQGSYPAVEEFIEGRPADLSYQTATNARLYSLPEPVFSALIKKYPSVKQNLRQLAQAA